MRLRVEDGARQETTHLVWGPLALFIVLAAWFLQGAVEKLPPCVFKEIVGLPCLTCGATRSIVALSHRDIGLALALNPLVPVLVAGLMVLSLITFLGWVIKRRIVLTLSVRQKNVIRLLALLAIVVNWLYLIAVGR
jgi:hypothetical protein